VVDGEGRSSFSFFVHGVRHILRSRPEVDERLRRLVPAYQRLLVRIEGRVSPGHRAFAGRSWAPVA
jgi:hypothetical protein